MKCRPVSLLAAGAGERLRQRHADAVLAAAPQQAMKARRRDQVLVERLGVEAERAHGPRDDAGRPGRQVGVARIAAPDVRAERAAQAVRVGAIGEGVQVAGDAAAVDRFVGRRRPAARRRGCGRPSRSASRSRAPASPPAQRSTKCQKPARPGAAGAARGSCRCGRGRRGRARPRRAAGAARRRARIEQRPVGVAAVLVRIAEQVLAEAAQVRVVAALARPAPRAGAASRRAAARCRR